MCSFPYNLSQFARISFNFWGLYPSIVRALSILIPLKRGRGVLSFIFFCGGRMDKRTVEFHIICYLVGNLCNGHTFIATDVEDAIRRMFY